MKLTGEKGVIRHFLRDCELKPLSPQTIKSYRHHLLVLVNLLETLCSIVELEEITVHHLRECVEHLLTTPSDNVKGVYRKDGETLDIASVRAHVRVWKVFFNWCYREELINKSPADSRLSLPKSPKKVTVTFSDEQIQQMLLSCDTSTEIGFRDYVILLLLLDTGIRLDEIATLRLDGFQETYIKVMGKGRREREVGLHPDVSKLVWKYIHKYRKPKMENESSLFISIGKKHSGLGFDRDGVASLLRRIKKVTGLNADSGVRLSAHTFRHTFSKMYMQQGGEILSLSRELGHSNVSITEKYLGTFGSQEARKEHASFSPISRINIKKNQKKKKK